MADKSESTPRILTGPGGERLIATGEYRTPDPDEWFMAKVINRPMKCNCEHVLGDTEREILRLATPEEVEAAERNPFSKGYKHRHGEPVSDACGDGKHSECTQDLTKCHCTVRGGHTIMHAYANFPSPAVAEETQPEPKCEAHGPHFGDCDNPAHSLKHAWKVMEQTVAAPSPAGEPENPAEIPQFSSVEDMRAYLGSLNAASSPAPLQSGEINTEMIECVEEAAVLLRRWRGKWPQ